MGRDCNVVNPRLLIRSSESSKSLIILGDNVLDTKHDEP